MHSSGGVRDMVILNGTPSLRMRSKLSSRGMYVSVIASYSQSSSRKSLYSG
jgi:hypothetical protein